MFRGANDPMPPFTFAMERLPLLRDRRAIAYGLTSLFIALGWGVRWALDPMFPPGFPYLTFFPVVILSSFLFGRGPGIFAAVICGLLSWYFWVAPFHAFAITRGTVLAMSFYTFVVTVDIALIDAMQRGNHRLAREKEVSARLAERTETLFHELQHRVSNNLQMVGALLALQQRQVKDEGARVALADAASKIQLIGRIQRQLYSTSGEQVPLGQFLRHLATDVVKADGHDGVSCRVVADDDILLPADMAIPLALIMAEAMANAVEHGFRGRDGGRISVSLARQPSGISLCVEDDGVGLPPGFDIKGTSSLGIKMIRSLARQLEGTLALEPTAGGTAMRLSLPLPVVDAT